MNAESQACLYCVWVLAVILLVTVALVIGAALLGNMSGSVCSQVFHVQCVHVILTEFIQMIYHLMSVSGQNEKFALTKGLSASYFCLLPSVALLLCPFRLLESPCDLKGNWSVPTQVPFIYNNSVDQTANITRGKSHPD